MNTTPRADALAALERLRANDYPCTEEGTLAYEADVRTVEAALATPPADARAVAWYTDDHLNDRSATTYDPVVAERWRVKGWPVTPLYATPPAAPATSGEGREDVASLRSKELDEALIEMQTAAANADLSNCTPAESRAAWRRYDAAEANARRAFRWTEQALNEVREERDYAIRQLRDRSATPSPSDAADKGDAS